MIELWDRETRCASLDVLLAVWERAVRSTHKFLQEEDIRALRPVVQEALLEVVAVRLRRMPRQTGIVSMWMSTSKMSRRQAFIGIWGLS